jgi:2-oxo-4-hydroxy-4-carboxy--5-ureidoimidazoline (OHCU) decarboxylase
MYTFEPLAIAYRSRCSLPSKFVNSQNGRDCLASILVKVRARFGTERAVEFRDALVCSLAYPGGAML